MTNSWELFQGSSFDSTTQPTVIQQPLLSAAKHSANRKSKVTKYKVQPFASPNSYPVFEPEPAETPVTAIIESSAHAPPTSHGKALSSRSRHVAVVSPVKTQLSPTHASTSTAEPANAAFQSQRYHVWCWLFCNSSFHVVFIAIFTAQLSIPEAFRIRSLTRTKRPAMRCV